MSYITWAEYVSTVCSKRDNRKPPIGDHINSDGLLSAILTNPIIISNSDN